MKDQPVEQTKIRQMLKLLVIYTGGDSTDEKEIDNAEAAISAHIVSVLEELKEHAVPDMDTGRNWIFESVIDAAIAMYKPTTDEQERIDFHKEVSSNATKFKQEPKS